MQIWNDGALEARVGSNEDALVGLTDVQARASLDAGSGGTIAIMGADPLARRALASALAFVGLGDDVLRGEGRSGVRGVDVVLYDDGASPATGALRPAPEAEERWLALVATGGRARAAMAGGFRGAVGRDATPEVLAAAIAALRQGLMMVDPRFSAEVLPPPAPLVEPLALTPREHQVLELLAEGLSNKEIGAQLGVSPHTAKFHVTALLDKLGAETRTEAVVLAARSGLLDL